jgi:6-phosphofructokinase 2
MHKIITVTFNPCIDKSTTIPNLVAEKKLICTQPKFEPGGGGLNVARAIKKLGGEALAVFPAGGYTGVFLTELLGREDVPFHVIKTRNHTRENLIVLDQSTIQQYRFGMPGSELYEDEWQECLNVIERSDAEFIIASGSLPPGVPTDIFGRIAAIAQKKNAKLIVDTSGEALKKAVQEGIYLFKPNLGELSSIVGKEEVTHEIVDDIAKEIINKGNCEVIIVSMGPAGARMITKNETCQIIPPVVRRLSTVGAGDSMVAGIVLSLSKGKSIREAIQFGVASGTAATMNPGTELCKLRDVEELFRIIKRECGEK